MFPTNYPCPYKTFNFIIACSIIYLLHEEDVPNLHTYVNWTPLCEWYVVRCGFKNGYQEDICLKEIRLCVQNMITIIDLDIQHDLEIEGGGKRSYMTT